MNTGATAFTGNVSMTASNTNPVPGEIVTFTISVSGTAPAGTWLDLQSRFHPYVFVHPEGSLDWSQGAIDNIRLLFPNSADRVGVDLWMRVSLTTDSAGDFSATWQVRLQFPETTAPGTVLNGEAFMSEPPFGREFQVASDAVVATVTEPPVLVTGNVSLSGGPTSPWPDGVVTFSIGLNGTAPMGTDLELVVLFTPYASFEARASAPWGRVHSNNLWYSEVYDQVPADNHHSFKVSLEVLSDGDFSGTWNVQFGIPPGTAIGSLANITASLNEVGSGSPGSSLASHSVDLTIVPPPNPVLTLNRTVSPAEISAPGPVMWTYVVRNDGNVHLINPDLTDGLIHRRDIDCDPETSGNQRLPSELGVGEEVTCTALTLVDQDAIDAGDPITSTAQVTGHDVAPDEAVATVTILQRPSATLSLSVAGETYDAVGEELAWTFVVANTENVTLTGLGLAGDVAGLGPMDCDPAGGVQPLPSRLSPGAEVSCVATLPVTLAHLNDGSVSNLATLRADQIDDLTDAATATAIPLPALDLVKTVSSATTDLDTGDVVTYEIVVTNTGNVTVTGVSVNDAGADDLNCAGSAELDPEASMTCTASYTISESDLLVGSYTNTASAEGSFTPTAPVPPSIQGFQTAMPISVTAEGSATVTTVALDLGLHIVKSADSAGKVRAGDTVTYTFVVTNTGNAALHDVTVSDPLPGLDWVDGPGIGELARGESVTLTAIYVVSKDDSRRGEVVNTADATGVDPLCLLDEPAEDGNDVASAAGVEGAACEVRATPSTVTVAVQQPVAPSTPITTDAPIIKLPSTGSHGGGAASTLVGLLGGLAAICAVTAWGTWRHGIPRR